MINSEDRADVKRTLGAGVAKKVASATNDAKNKALRHRVGDRSKYYSEESPKFRYKKESGMRRAWEKTTGKKAE